MRSGVSFPSYASQATWTFQSGHGSAAAGFPQSNLTDLFNIRSVLKTATSALGLQFNLPAARTIQFIGFLHHNGLASDTIQIRLWSDNNPDPVGNLAHRVYDSGSRSLFPGGIDRRGVYPQSFPLVLPTPLSVQSGLINVSNNGNPWVVGAIEIAGWWEWSDVAVARSFGLKINDVVAPQPFGVDHAMSTFNPRIVSGTRDLTDQSENSTLAVDFQNDRKTSNPFVWVQDIDDTTTYQRETILVRNSRIIPPSMGAYPSGKQSFDFVEHLR